MLILAPLPLFLALAAAPGGDRLLLCRPVIRGEPALAKAEAVAAAAKEEGSAFLDYGVACEGEEEAARAASRAGLAMAVSSVAEGRTEGSRYLLSLTPAGAEKALARRTVEVAPGADAVPGLRDALAALRREVPQRRDGRVAPWVVAGGGATLLLAGAAFALAARGDASSADRAWNAGDPVGYLRHRASWRRWRTASGATLAAGAAAAAVGLTWRFAF